VGGHSADVLQQAVRGGLGRAAGRGFSLQRCRYRRWPPPRLRAEQVDHLSILFVQELGLKCKVCALFGDPRR